MCTNGFEHITIENPKGKDINTAFHQGVHGYIGYMSGYREPLERAPIAISYSRSNEVQDNETETYYYMTRRPFDSTQVPSNLISVGGPGRPLENHEEYRRESGTDADAALRIDMFLKENYRHHADNTQYEFHWHGLMGYTPDALRRIGFEPRNPVLLYNLGCNGVGILPSVYGGVKIARHLADEEVPPSIFDPKDLDQRT